MNWQEILSKILSFFTSSQPTPQPVVPSFDGTTLTLNRKTWTQFSTSGELSINGSFQCYTIECPKVSYQGSHVCIPAGIYIVKLIDSPKHGPNTPELQDVPGRTEIEIHSANWAINPQTKQVYLLGCIAPGSPKDPDVVYNSKVAMAAIMSKVDWTKPVRIIVND